MPPRKTNKAEHLAAAALSRGEVIAYPTEAVFGLGCDPGNQQAVERLLALKGRPVEKGLILIAGDITQLQQWIDLDRLHGEFPHVLERWPGPVTWLLPCKADTPHWLTGRFDSLAVRVSAHPQVQDLCASFGSAIVSTSANPTGQPPARDEAEVGRYFPDLLVLPGAVDRQASPSTIIDARSQQVLRP